MWASRVASPFLKSTGYLLTTTATATSISTTTTVRHIHESAVTSRNLLAKYAVPPIPPPPLRTSSHDAQTPHPDEGFLTSSTNPVSASVQSVPAHPHATLDHASNPNTPPSSGTIQDDMTHVAEPIPAMKPVADGQAGVNAPAQTTGSASSGSGRTAPLIVQGVEIPPKPKPPGEEECCMSGCVNCVYTIYSDEVIEYNDALACAAQALKKNTVPLSKWPPEVRAVEQAKVKQSSDDGGGDGDASGAERKSKDQIKEQVMDNDMDPSLKAFLQQVFFIDYSPGDHLSNLTNALDAHRMEAKLKAKKAKADKE